MGCEFVSAFLCGLHVSISDLPDLRVHVRVYLFAHVLRYVSPPPPCARARDRARFAPPASHRACRDCEQSRPPPPHPSTTCFRINGAKIGPFVPKEACDTNKHNRTQ